MCLFYILYSTLIILITDVFCESFPEIFSDGIHSNLLFMSHQVVVWVYVPWNFISGLINFFEV